MNTELLGLIEENSFINRIASILPRSENAVNRTHESDSEIVEIGLPGHYLAVTTDEVAEEIREGLYSEPEFIGWMAMAVNLSDLAAVGASPIGMLLSTTVSPAWDAGFLERLSQGMAEAMKAHGCGSLGGDLNVGEPSLGATAIGLVEKDRVMMRTGMKRGDIVYMTGPAGLGGAFAMTKLMFPDLTARIPYKPVARLREGRVISRHATACMDTSDGIIFTLDQLYRLNGLKFDINDIGSIVHSSVKSLSNELGIHPLAILCAIHGDFELCFSIPPENEAAFLDDMRKAGLAEPVRVCAAGDGEGVFIGGRLLETGKVRNLWTGASSTSEYVNGLLELIGGFLG